jgi:hypothetical protein
MTIKVIISIANTAIFSLERDGWLLLLDVNFKEELSAIEKRE